ncbi:hypothetical protein JTE90_025637 [Oedothorax gibbosus]|uniref:Uncharacterized protein n=1 Tax=Oedothorax gibbosus TaxID=931172 RepID=A0AAV6V876_9ARAC|nr:hypothetical protein JTE90_025637 [Oedothorax gibbosus]
MMDEAKQIELLMLVQRCCRAGELSSEQGQLMTRATTRPSEPGNIEILNELLERHGLETIKPVEISPNPLQAAECLNLPRWRPMTSRKP